MNIIMATKSINIMEQIISKLISPKFPSSSCIILPRYGNDRQFLFHNFTVVIATLKITIKAVDTFALRISFTEDLSDLSILMASGR